MFPETAVKPPWRELFSKNLFQQCAVMVGIDEAHCIHEWLENVHFITIITRVHVPHYIVQGTWLLDGIPQDGELRVSQKFHSCASCLSFSSNRVGDYSSSRAHKSCFCEELLQEANIWCYVIKKSSMSMYMRFLSCALNIIEAESQPKTCKTKSTPAKVYLFLHKAASSQIAVNLYHVVLY